MRDSQSEKAMKTIGLLSDAHRYLVTALIADVMLFHKKTLKGYNLKNRINQEALFKSMFNSFQQMVDSKSMD